MEYLSDVEGELTDVELDHWAYGPHHLWSYPESGQILRMWQPFNGLQVSKEPPISDVSTVSQFMKEGRRVQQGGSQNLEYFADVIYG